MEYGSSRVHKIYIYIYIYIYILKLKCSIYCFYVPIEPHQCPPHYHFLSNFLIIVFNIYFLFYFNIYTFSNRSPPLPFHLHYPLYKYYPSSFHLSTTFYINILLLLLLSLHRPLFCLFFYFVSSYSHSLTINL